MRPARASIRIPVSYDTTSIDYKSENADTKQLCPLIRPGRCSILGVYSWRPVIFTEHPVLRSNTNCSLCPMNRPVGWNWCNRRPSLLRRGEAGGRDAFLRFPPSAQHRRPSRSDLQHLRAGDAPLR